MSEPRRLSFTMETADDAGSLEPIEVELKGGPPLSKEDWVEEFLVMPVAPAGVLDDLVSSVITDPGGRRQYSAPSLLRFMQGVLVDQDNRDRFDDLCHDTDRVVPLEKLGQIVTALSDEVTGRPTMPSSGSTNGRRAGGGTSGRTSPAKAGKRKN